MVLKCDKLTVVAGNETLKRTSAFTARPSDYVVVPASCILYVGELFCNNINKSNRLYVCFK